MSDFSHVGVDPLLLTPHFTQYAVPTNIYPSLPPMGQIVPDTGSLYLNMNKACAADPDGRRYLQFQVQVSLPHCARFGVFTAPEYDTADDWNADRGRTWGFLGIADPKDPDKQVFFIGKAIRRTNILPLQLTMVGFDIRSCLPNAYLTNQPSTMSCAWCPQVYLGPQRYQQFLQMDTAAVTEMSILIDGLRRVCSGASDDPTIYAADKILNRYESDVRLRGIQW